MHEDAYDGYGFGEDGLETGGTGRGLRSLISGLTVRGSTMASDLADSWFGLGSHEEHTVEGPSVLERRLNIDAENDSLVPSLLLWDPAQLDLGFDKSWATPSVPPREDRPPLLGADHLADSLICLPTSSAHGASLGDFEMDLIPPPLPARESYHPLGQHALFADGTASRAYAHTFPLPHPPLFRSSGTSVMPTQLCHPR